MTDQSTDFQDRYHYNVVRRAIAAIDASPFPLSLDQLAADIGMSPTHFQRVFSKWAGVSPKRYQQYLALDHAKHLLAERHRLLDVADAVGLSGTSRLHDLFLRWEAMSPGQFSRQGEGVALAWGAFDTPFGRAVAVGSDHGLTGLGFADATGEEATLADLLKRWPDATVRHAPERVSPWVEAAVHQRGDVKMHMIGGPFQIKVWEALLAIPTGEVTTYGDIATAIGAPGASRAVGTAVGRNPIAWLIPCHRVLRREGSLGGYHWGPPVKRAMLAWEAVRADAH